MNVVNVIETPGNALPLTSQGGLTNFLDQGGERILGTTREYVDAENAKTTDSMRNMVNMKSMRSMRLTRRAPRQSGSPGRRAVCAV